MDCLDNLCAHHHGLRGLLQKKKNSGHLDLWGPSYGHSKKVLVKLVPKLGLFSHFLSILFQRAITLV